MREVSTMSMPWPRMGMNGCYCAVYPPSTTNVCPVTNLNAFAVRVYPKSTPGVPPVHYRLPIPVADSRIAEPPVLASFFPQGDRSMQRITFFLYGLSAHVLFFGVYAWLIGFVTGFVVPRTIDKPAGQQPWLAVAVDLLLLVGF